MKRASLALAALLVATPVSAQMGHGDASLAPMRGLYQTVRGYITAAAEQMPEDKYSYRPTDEVRSFGQIIGHVANAEYLFCAPVLGQQAPQMADAEKLTSKAEIVAALEAAFKYCDAAYQVGDPDTALQFFGQPNTKLSVLAFNMGHAYEHYGNIVTYMRLNGMVPPSSQGSGM
jgi:uncharacterized damage-inducible protein DinB